MKNPAGLAYRNHGAVEYIGFLAGYHVRERLSQCYRRQFPGADRALHGVSALVRRFAPLAVCVPRFASSVRNMIMLIYLSSLLTSSNDWGISGLLGQLYLSW